MATGRIGEDGDNGFNDSYLHAPLEFVDSARIRYGNAYRNCETPRGSWLGIDGDPANV